MSTASISPAGAGPRTLNASLDEHYGEWPELRATRARQLEHLLEQYRARFGEKPAALYRIPSRIALNPHTDHQGGWVPYGCHSRELLLAAGPGESDVVTLENVDPACARPLSFRISEEKERGAWDGEWRTYIESEGVLDSVSKNVDRLGANWPQRGALNYVRAAVMRLVHEKCAPERGMRIMLCSDVPQGGGQSSSSTLVVGAALAFLGDHRLAHDRRALAALCGQAEQYVGTRGGSGDHAAMLLGERGCLTHICFRHVFNVHDCRQTRFPAGYELLLVNSRVQSRKSAAEKILFNTGIFAYRFAFLALRQAIDRAGLLPVGGLSCLGDLHDQILNRRDLYRAVMALPLYITPSELRDRFPEDYAAAAQGCFGLTDPESLPQEIPLRGAAVYGLGRVDRGRVMPELIASGDRASMAEFGRLMDVTHNGDRRFLREAPWRDGLDELQDASLLQLLSRPEPPPFRDLAGFYGASIVELDTIVDLLRDSPGVLGAGLMGAGGGGYVVALLEAGYSGVVTEALEAAYYGPNSRIPDVEPWLPMSGAGRLM